MIDYYDVESETMMLLAGKLKFKDWTGYQSVRRFIMERLNAFRSGTSFAPRWLQKGLKAIDPLLQARWDFEKQHFIIERFSRADHAWVQVLDWPHQLTEEIFAVLRAADTWRFETPEAYLAYKRAQSATVREANRKKGDNAILEAVDGLTRARAENFMEVEKALATGETVIFSGESEKTMDRMHEGAKKAAAAGEALIKNQKPMAYKYPKGGECI